MELSVIAVFVCFFVYLFEHNSLTSWTPYANDKKEITSI